MIRNAIALTVLSAAALLAEAPLLSLVDPAVGVIGGVNVTQTLSSPLGRYLLSQMNEGDAEFRKFVETTGFDPRHDVRKVVMASSDTSRKNGFIAARGVFNGPAILAAAQAHGAVATAYASVPVAASKDGQWLAIVGGSLALMGDQALVRYAIDHSGGAAAPASALAGKAASLANAHDAWILTTGTFTPPNSGRGTPAAPAAALAGILETSAGMNFGETVRVTAEAVTRSEKDAQALVDVINFMANMARNSVQSNPEARKLEPVLNNLQVNAQADKVTLSFSILESDLEQLIKPKRSTRRAAR